MDRQPGYGGLQVQNLDGTWADAPYVPDAFTVNVADLLSRWSGGRWRSTRHRVLPPPAQAPDEELISLIVFLEAEVDTVIKPVAGDLEIEPVVAGDWLREREAAATVLPGGVNRQSPRPSLYSEQWSLVLNLASPVRAYEIARTPPPLPVIAAQQCARRLASDLAQHRGSHLG